MPSYYEILEVSPAASPAEMRAAYLELARQYHPDRVPEHLTKLRADAEEKLKLVNEAWRVLSDPARRRKYDVLMKNGGGQADSRRAARTPPVPPARVAPDILSRLNLRRDAVKWALIVSTLTLLLVVGGELIAFRNSGASSSSFESSSGNKGQPGTHPPRRVVPQIVVHSSAPAIRLRNSLLAAGAMDLQLLDAAVSDDQIELTFRVRADGRGGSLLYEPPGGTFRQRNILGRQVEVDRGLEEMYLVDGDGVKHYSTTGLVGGKQSNFDIYNFTRRIDFAAHAETTLSAAFLRGASRDSTVTLVSPALGMWQPEWRWPEIRLK